MDTGPPGREHSLAEATWGVAFRDGRVHVVSRNRTAPLRDAAHLVLQGEASLSTNNTTAAIAAFVRAIRIDPTLTNAYVGLGTALIRHHQAGEGLAAFRSALDLEPRHANARFHLAMALGAAGQLEEAILEMTTVTRFHPDHALAHERLAIWTYYVGRYTEAWVSVRSAERLGRSLPPQFLRLLERRSPDPN